MIYIAPKKRRVPDGVRRAVALRFGPMGRGVLAQCFYCGAEGTIHWMSPSWLHVRNLEFDHVVPEVRGGQAVEDNVVLACQRCNRSKGFRRTAEQMAVAA